MQFQKKLGLSQVLLHLTLGASAFFLCYIGKYGEPYALALLFAVLLTRLNPVPALLFYVLSGLFFTTEHFIVYAGQAALLLGSYFLCKKIQSGLTQKLVYMLALSLCLGGFIAFAPFSAYPLPFAISLPAVGQKAGIAAIIFLLAACCFVALNAILKKLLKCRLHGDEILFSLLLCVLIGVGVCNALSVNAYFCIAFYVLLLFTLVVADANSVLCALILSIPPFLAVKQPIVYLLVCGVAIFFFVRFGRLAMTLALLATFFGYGYFNGLYALPAPQFGMSVFAVTLPCLLFILTPAPLVKELENKLVYYRERHLSRIAINRNRRLISEKLFEISAVFREIECAFLALDSNENTQSAKEYICGCVLEEVCKNCHEYAVCSKKKLAKELDKLIDVGAIKGKVHLLDLPKALTESCISQTEIINAVNRQLIEYRKYLTESQNAASGRALLANQAQGVSEILKNLALEQSAPLRIYTDTERRLSSALASAGIVCSEVLLYGDEEAITLSLLTYSRANVKKIAAVASHILNEPMMISERIALHGDKYCCILHKKPCFDAAFGVANVKKQGASASGDTHSVIKIDERKFMVALSDGMGSGEYAKQVSESTISLLESFYRAKMPSALVLSTVNKLLTFHKEETFACVDIAIVDLDNGNADVIKIGAPFGFILTANSVKVLEGGALPLGILDSLRPDVSSYTLEENDVLLFLSDGVTDAFGSTADLYEALKTFPIRNPQQLADMLIERALENYGGVAKDDMTALAVRLYKSK